MPRPAALALALGTAVVGPLLAAGTAYAASGTSSAGTAAGGWYRPCTAPAGCDAAPPSGYSEGTLHVGVTAGREDARSYLRLDASSVPTGATLTGGALRLQLATGQSDGTFRPETAKVRACLVLGTVADDAAGATTAPPDVDCGVSATATYVAAQGPAPAALTLDLAPLAREWTPATASLALLPADGAAATDAWHVAFAEKGGVAATLAWTAPDAAAAPPPAAPPALEEAAGTGFAAGPLDAGSPALGPVATDGGAAPAPAPAPAPAVAGPAAAAAPVVEQQAVVNAAATVPQAAPRFAYPAVFLLPIVLAGVGAVVARAMTRDLSAR